MSLAGVFRLFSAKPRQPVGDDGRMALADHLRELRARLLQVSILLMVGTVLAWVFYEPLLNIVTRPYVSTMDDLQAEGIDTEPVISGIARSLLLQLKISALTAVVLSSPFWLYQIWAFVVPGLHAHEKRWTRLFAAVAGPLFLAGVAVGYYVLPKGIEVLLGFTPEGVTSLVEFSDYLSFFIRMLLVFGVAFEIPLFVVMLSLAGVVSGKSLGEHRPWIVLGTFLFAAVATPSTDPFSMLMLALPMTLLFLVSEGVARFIDRRRAKATAALAGLADDEVSPLELEDEHYQPSSLDERDD